MLALFALAACGASGEDSAYGDDYDSSYLNRREDALEDARANLDGLTYQDQRGSWGCTDDCSGHDAGYEWAQENGIEDAGDCGGNSDSFIEGCEAYAEDLESELDSELDNGIDEAEGYRDEW